ncbi:MAG: succinyl-diaminopimelate desuccinylase [Polyangiaceae bacterium]
MTHESSVAESADSLERRLDETLLWLTSIASPIGEEKALCDAIQARLAAVKLHAPIRRVKNSIVVCLARSAEPKPHVVFAGHTDTVRTENGPARLEGGRCFGAGASDMKSGLAVMLALAETVDATKLDCHLTLVFYAREEGPFAENELGPVLDEARELDAVDLAVCLEPSDNRLHLGCNGSLHATLTFRGRTAHSARPWEGESAITKCASFLSEVGALAPEPHTLDGLVYRTVTTVTQIKDGGRGRNVVPDVVTVNVNHRFAPDTTIAEAEARLHALVAGRAEVTLTDRSPSARPSRNHPLVDKLVRAGVAGVEPKQAWTDVARFSAKGIAAVNFGPGENAQAHQKNESTALALVHEGYRILARFLGVA